MWIRARRSSITVHPVFRGNLTIDRVEAWHAACKHHRRVSYVTKSAAIFLVLLILSPVTAPFASVPLSALLTHKADTQSSRVVMQFDASVSASAGAASFLVEEQTKDGEVIFDSRTAVGSAWDTQDGTPLGTRSTALERRHTRFVVLRV